MAKGKNRVVPLKTHQTQQASLCSGILGKLGGAGNTLCLNEAVQQPEKVSLVGHPFFSITAQTTPVSAVQNVAEMLQVLATSLSIM